MANFFRIINQRSTHLYIYNVVRSEEKEGKKLYSFSHPLPSFKFTHYKLCGEKKSDFPVRSNFYFSEKSVGNLMFFSHEKRFFSLTRTLSREISLPILSRFIFKERFRSFLTFHLPSHNRCDFIGNF